MLADLAADHHHEHLQLFWGRVGEEVLEWFKIVVLPRVISSLGLRYLRWPWVQNQLDFSLADQ